MYTGLAFKRQELTRFSIGQTKLCGKKISLRFPGFLDKCSRRAGGEGEGHEWGKGLRSTRAHCFAIRSSLSSYASMMSEKVRPDLQTASRTCNSGSTTRHHNGKHVGYLQTFFVRTDGTVGNGKAYAAISDSVEGLVTSAPDLGGHPR